ncbi:collagen alpha-1(XV) chain-like [Lineus longissimus]|uniref:collagen alpha-1(XV) chain-like n=1 Tax=Lineus longissimus TaxID=88925 RepID=UPI00315D8348
MSAKPIVKFTVPNMVDKWTRLALSVRGNMTDLYFNCVEYDRYNTVRTPVPLPFDAGSTLYIGQGGGEFNGKFLGSLQELSLYSDPDTAAKHCDVRQERLNGHRPNRHNGEGSGGLIDTDDEDMFGSGNGEDKTTMTVIPVTQTSTPPTDLLAECSTLDYQYRIISGFLLTPTPGQSRQPHQDSLDNHTRTG